MPTSTHRRRKPKRKSGGSGTKRSHAGPARPPLGPGAGSAADVRAALERHACPLPYHAVRARFMGAIASPEIQVKPMAVVLSLWGGELPEFQGLEEAQALIDTLLTGLWNRLSVHQDLSRPFRLTALDPPVDSGAINRYASIRKEELEAFVNGLFGDNEAMDLPESAHEAMGFLRDTLSFFDGYLQLAGEIVSPEQVAESATRLQQLTIASEAEIHTVIRSSARARRATLSPTTPP